MDMIYVPADRLPTREVVMLGNHFALRRIEPATSLSRYRRRQANVNIILQDSPSDRQCQRICTIIMPPWNPTKAKVPSSTGKCRYNLIHAETRCNSGK